MGGRLLEGPTMVGRTSDWKEELGRFLKPFLDRLGHKARRQMCPLYVSGLIGPGDRKSIQPMAERLGFGESGRLPDAAVPVSGTFLTSSRWRLKRCWQMPDGGTSLGAPERKESSRLVLLLSACGSPTDHRSGSGTRVSNICQGMRLGSSANTGCQERRNTISPTCRRTPTCAP